MPFTYDPDAIAVAPEGTYPVTVVDIKEKPSKNGDPMWIIEMEDDSGNEITEFVVHRPNIIDWKFKPLWIAAGLSWPEGKAVLDEVDLIGKRVLATVKHQKSKEYGTRANIDGYEPIESYQAQLGDGKEFETAPASAADDEDIPF